MIKNENERREFGDGGDSVSDIPNGISVSASGDQSVALEQPIAPHSCVPVHYSLTAQPTHWPHSFINQSAVASLAPGFVREFKKKKKTNPRCFCVSYSDAIKTRPSMIKME
jgi:hypothetical protein